MGERGIDWLPPLCPQTKVICVCTWAEMETHSLGMCPDWKLNLQPFGYRMMLQPMEPYQPRQMIRI